MTYPDFYAARLYVAERRFGAPLRRQQRAEQAKIERTKRMIRRHEASA